MIMNSLSALHICTSVLLSLVLICGVSGKRNETVQTETDLSGERECHGMPCNDYRRIQQKTLKLLNLYKQNRKTKGSDDFWDSIEGTALEHPETMSDLEWETAVMHKESTETFDEDFLDEEIEKQMSVAAGYNTSLFHDSGEKKRRDLSLQTNKKWIDTSRPLLWAFQPDASFNEHERSLIRKTFQEVNDKTCFTYSETSYHGGDRRHLEVLMGNKDGGCYAAVNAGRKRVNLGNGCVQRYVIIHEIMHTMGFNHEHLRSDRDQYLKFFEENMSDYGRGEYAKKTTKEEYGGLAMTTPYDFATALNYAPTLCSRNGKWTHAPHDELYNDSLEHKNRYMTFYDAKAANLSPMCSGFCANKQSAICHHGGYPHPKDCHKCVCPEGFSSSSNCLQVEVMGDGCSTEIDLDTDATWREFRSPWVKKFDQNGRSVIYKKLLKCNWLIRARKGYRVQMKFHEDYHRFGIRCGHAYLQIHHTGRLETGPRVCAFTGSKPEIIRNRYISDDNEMMVVLNHFGEHTEEFWRRGFVALVRAVKHDQLPREEQKSRILPKGYQEKIFYNSLTLDNLKCDFEKANLEECSMTQQTDDQIDWQFSKGPTSTFGTGPDAAKTGQWYAYIEGSYPSAPGDKAGLVLPGAGQAGKYCLVFWYCMHGAHVASLSVKDSGGHTLWTETGNKGKDWIKAEATAQLSKGGTFIITAERGPNFRSDIAIDDVSVRLC